MGIVGFSTLIIVVILSFAAVIFWAVVVQPRAEHRRASVSPDEAWRTSGLEPLRLNGFSLYQIVPTDRMKAAEFIIQDENRQKIGRYVGSFNLGSVNESAGLEYGGKHAALYIQGTAIGKSIYAGKVGGTSSDSIVIRNEAIVIAEIWRENALPPVHYRFFYRDSSETFRITTGGLSPTKPGSIAQADATQSDKPVGAFRRSSLTSRNIFVALHNELSDEVKVCLCAIILLQ